MKRRTPASRGELLLSSFLGVMRVKYLQMLQISEKHWAMHKKMLEQTKGSTGEVGEVDLLEHRTDSIEARINYFSFIEELNRFGRAFESVHKKVIPDSFLKA